MKYNKSKVMSKAWEIFREFFGTKNEINFGEALHRAWNYVKAEPINEQRIQNAKSAIGIDEDVNTWSGWYDLGYEVIHESKALFQIELIYASKGDGAIYKASFFSKNQVTPIGTQPPKKAA